MKQNKEKVFKLPKLAGRFYTMSPIYCCECGLIQEISRIEKEEDPMTIKIKEHHISTCKYYETK